jgi:hypothetical protein
LKHCPRTGLMAAISEAVNAHAAIAGVARLVDARA